LGDILKLGSDISFFEGLGVQVLEVPERKQQWVLKNDPMTFLSWFDSPVGIVLLDIRKVVLVGVKKSPALLALVDSYGPQTLGQWIFACDPQGLCSLTFGVQLPKAVLTAEVLKASLNHLSSFTEIGGEILSEIASDPDAYPGSLGGKVIRSGATDSSAPAKEISRDEWPLKMDAAYDALDAGQRDKAKEGFESLVGEGWVGARLALIQEFGDDYSVEEGLRFAHESMELAFPDYELIGMHFKYAEIPKLMHRRVQEEHRNFSEDKDPQELMGWAKELGAYLFQSWPEILEEDWVDEGAIELSVTFANICVSFFSTWDLSGMPMRHDGRLLNSLDFVSMNASSKETQDWALGRIRQLINGWGEKIPTTVLLDSSALAVLEKYS